MADSNDDDDALSATVSISAYFVLFSFLLALVLILSKVLHDHNRISKFLPEAGLILLVGIMAGAVVNLFLPIDVMADDQSAGIDDDGEQQQQGAEDVAQSLLSFSPEVFFVALLPPIIFNSGYHLRRELFFRHIVPITLFATLGTLISALCISFLLEFIQGLGLTGDFKPTFTELLTFGALISATDPVSTLAVFQAKRVDPHLFYLVFGESVLNDAVGLVLFDAFRQFVDHDNGAGKVVIGVSEFIIGFLLDSVGSPFLGIICGCAAALLFKHVDMRDHVLLELSVYMLIMYVPFLLAELIQLSGIVTILFCGMTARAYVVPNLSTDTARTAEILFRLFANMAETSIFLELGLSVFGLRGSIAWKFTFWALFACIVGRALNIYPIAFMYNQRLQTEPQTQSELIAEHILRKRQLEENHLEMTETTEADGSNHSQPIPQSDALVRGPSGGDTVSSSAQTATPRVRRDLKISYNKAHMMCFSGLRGAVAYACVRSFPDTFGHSRAFVVTTMFIVLVTVFVFGGTTNAMLNFLRIEKDVNEEQYMETWHQERQSPSFLLKLEDAIQRNVVRCEVNLQCLQPTASGDNDGPGGSSSVGAPASSTDYSNVGSTEERHFQSMEGNGHSPGKKRSSLFDYGKKGS